MAVGDEKAKRAAAAVRQKARLSPAYWFAVFARIYDKFQKLVTPKPNICQLRLAQAYEWCRANKRPFRAIVLKPRQVGITTMAAAICYHHIRRFRSNMTMIADNLDRSDKLFQMIVTFAKEDLFPWGFGFQEPTADNLTLANGSQVEKKTAGNSSATRGGTVQVAHQSEVAFWPAHGVHNAKKTSVALTSSIPSHADTIDIKESTPQGSAGVFAEDWRRARWPVYDDYWKQYAQHGSEGDEDSEYIRIFAAWWEFDEYERAGTPARFEEIERTLTVREKRGRDVYGWSWEKINWRRWAITNLCSGSELRFDEEYPEDPVICFMSSGLPVFDPQGVAYLEVIARSTLWRTGVLTDPHGRSGVPAFVPTGEDQCMIRLLEDPREGLSYILPADVSSDRDISEEVTESDLDKHSAGVLRAAYTDSNRVFHRTKLVARLRWPCELGHDMLALQLHLLSLLYGGCPIALEINNQGHSVFAKLRELKANIIARTVVDPKTSKSHRVFGWETSPKSKPMIINSLAEAIRDTPDLTKSNGLDVFCPHVVSELATYVKIASRTEASAGCHDDDVMMLAIGNYLIGSAQKYVKQVVKVRGPDDGYRESREILRELGSALPKM